MTATKTVLIHHSEPKIAPVRAIYCDSFVCQLRGLTFRRELAPYEGLLLVQKRDSRVDAAIHMLFMAIDLAVIWFNQDGTVVDLVHAKRWQPAYIPAQPARYVLETHINRLQDFQIGEQLRLQMVENNR